MKCSPRGAVVSAEPAPRHGDQVLPYLWMLASAMAFACMGALAHGLGDVCDWQMIALARSGLSFVFAVLLGVAAGTQFVVWRPATLWLRGLAGSVSMVCTFYALTRLPVADVLTLSNVFPVWVAVLSRPVLGERPPAGVWVAIGTAVLGAALIQQPHLQAGNPAALIVLGGSFATALAMLGLHQLAGIDVRAIVAHFSGVAVIFCLAAFVVFPLPVGASALADGTTLAMLLGVGVAATVGQVLLTKAFTSGNPARVSVVALSQVGFAMLLDAMIWKRTLSLPGVVGMALVVAPTAWLLLKDRR